MLSCFCWSKFSQLWWWWWTARWRVPDPHQVDLPDSRQCNHLCNHLRNLRWLLVINLDPNRLISLLAILVAILQCNPTVVHHLNRQYLLQIVQVYSQCQDRLHNHQANLILRLPANHLATLRNIHPFNHCRYPLESLVCNPRSALILNLLDNLPDNHHDDPV